MERRRNRRWPRQLEVRVWRRGDEAHPMRATSANISRTGIFVRTQQVLPSGTRLRLEVFNGPRSFVAEGVVMRALKTPTPLQSVMPSGMGIRFIHIEELLGELLPGLDLMAEELVPGGVSSPLGGAARAAAAPQTAPPATVVQGASPIPAASTAAASPAITGSLFPLVFRDREQFRRAFERDISTGGLFVTTDRPLALDSVVEVEVGVEGTEAAPVRLQARVVHRTEPTAGEEGNLLAGMGLQFLDVQRAVERLRSLL
jgi:uncharacterized protein (TIGR02266 family)